MINFKNHFSRAAFSKVCSADAKDSTSSSQDIRRYIYVMASLKFAGLQWKEYCFVENNRGKSPIADVFVAYEHQDI